MLPVGLSMREYAEGFFPVKPEGLDICVSVNGRLLEEGTEAAYLPAPGDSIAFCAVPHGGGGDGKNILRIVAMLALIIVAPYAAAAMGFATVSAAGVATLTLTGQIVAAGIVMGGGMLINSIFPAKLPQFEGNVGLDSSRSYGWNAEPNSAEIGPALPELFGTFRVTPPLLSRYIELDGDKQYLNMLFALAGHEVDAIDFESIRINGQPLANFKDVIPNVRLGANDQDPIPSFSDSRTDVALNVKLSTSYATRQTNNACDKLSVALIAPTGLWEAKSDGGLGSVSVALEAEYRKIGDPDWVPWLGNTGYLPGQRFRARTSSTQFSINNDTIKTIGTWYNLPANTEDKGRYRPGARIKALSPGGDTEHIVTSTSIAEVYGGYDSNTDITTRHVVTLVNVTGSLPSDMTGFEYSPAFEIAAAQSSAKRWMFKLEEPYGGLDNYEYRFKFALAPPTGTRYSTDIYLDFHQEITVEDFSYPNTALLSLRALATDQLQGGQPRAGHHCQPERGAGLDRRGLRVQVRNQPGLGELPPAP